MNFFHHQAEAHKQTRRLLALFILAVIAIVVAVNLVVLLSMKLSLDEAQLMVSSPADFWAQHGATVLITTVATIALILGGSLWRVNKLRQQGSRIAESLGGTAVPLETDDFSRRQLRNVVEEISIASGVPVPAIYVLEAEPGINAFAAGFSTDDAAVAVTQGCLDTLSRDELQGVIAHEFSHILNGDMRLNLRLMGWLHGILLISLIGQVLLRGGYVSGASVRRSSDSDRRSGGVVWLGLGLLVVGAVGLFFARLIKAGVSRQREYLADASAVQFTRNQQGLLGALEHIALAGSSISKPTAEQVSHMLFAKGMRSSWMDTHPPIQDRIRALEPSWHPVALEELHQRLVREHQTEQARASAKQDQ